jgi:hypothetical protein
MQHERDWKLAVDVQGGYRNDSDNGLAFSRSLDWVE